MSENDIVKALCVGFGLGNMSVYHTGTEGVSNKKYRITTDKGIYFVKVVKGISPDRIKYISDIELYMKSRGIPAIPMLKSISGHYWLYLGDDKYTVYPYIESDRSHKYSIEEYGQIGKMLAKIHWAGQKEVPPSLYRDFSIKPKIVDGLKILEKEKLHDYTDYKISMLEKLKEGSLYVKDTIIHSDFHPGNILFDSKSRKIVGICDWEKSEYASRASDLVHTLIYTNFHKGYIYEKAIEGARAMLRAYNKEFPISHPEILQGFEAHLCLIVLSPWIEEAYNSKKLIDKEGMIDHEWGVTRMCFDGRIQNDLL